MATRIPPSIGVEADRLEAAIHQARLSVDQEVGVWATYGDHGFAPAQHVLAAMKEAKNPTQLRQKAMPAGDEFDQLGQQIAATARAQAMQAGSDRATIVEHLRTVLSQLGRPQQATTKATAPSLKDMISNALDHVAREGIH